MATMRVLKLAAILLAGCAQSAAARQPPATFPLPAAQKPNEVAPSTRPATTEPPTDAVIPASAAITVDGAANAVPLRVVLARLQDGTREIGSTAVGLLGRIGAHVKRTADSRPIVITTQRPEAKPKVVVVRETEVESGPGVEGSASDRLDLPLLGGLGLTMVGGFSWLAFRKARKQTKARIVITPAPLDSSGVRLMGKYDAGPQREPAEKFDIGPSYREEVKQRERMVEASNAAAVELILGQNLALIAELNAGRGGSPTDAGTEHRVVPAIA